MHESIKYQRIIGATFTTMGIVTMLFPVTCLRCCLTGKVLETALIHTSQGIYTNGALKLAMQCFGSQATLCGVLLLNCEMTKHTFKVFGLSMIPYFLFDFLAFKDGYLTLFGAVGDLIGNVVFASCSYFGYRSFSVNNKRE